jgi:uncharacterized circularly permuted ATP-grasp superfamily protein
VAVRPVRRKAAVKGELRTSPAIDAYHRLLEDHELASTSAAMLAQGQRDRRLVFGGRPLCIALRPNLVARDQYEAITLAARSIYGALAVLERALLKDEELRRELDLAPQEERLAIADPGFSAASPSARLDGFVGDGVIRFVEYNAESPAGMAYNDELASVFAALPVMRALGKRFRLRRLPVRRKQLAAMVRAAGKPRPAIAIVDWRGLPTLTEFEMFERFFSQHGLRTVICAPEDLTFSRGRLRARGAAIDLVYRRVLTSELLARPDLAEPLVRAYLSGKVTVVNSFRAKLLHKKMSLALLSDDRYASLYSASQRRAIARHVPWTRKVREGHATYRGKVVDLVEFVIANRERLVLKPNDEYGGKGVVLGWTVAAREWEQTLLAALVSSYVVQERVPVPREPFPVVLDRMHFLDLAIDCDPYVFWGRPFGCLVRLSSSALLNVTAGDGSVVPTFVVEGQAA